MSSNHPRVFIDSSVLIAASISSRGTARDLVNAGIRGEITLLWSQLVITETERNLNAKAPAALSAFDRFRDAVGFEIATPDPHAVQRAAKIVDAKDAPIVAAAVAASATWIASYDRRHLLAFQPEIQAEFGVLVATPDEIMSHLS